MATSLEPLHRAGVALVLTFGEVHGLNLGDTMISMTHSEPPEEGSVWSQPGPQLAARWIGLLLFVGVGFLYMASGLVAPIWASTMLIGVWLVMLVMVIRIWKTRPWLVLASPIVAYLIWFLVIWAGDTFLDWTA